MEIAWRSLGIYQMVFQGGLAVGSAVWGLVAEGTSTAIALSMGAAGLIAGLTIVPEPRPARTSARLYSDTRSYWSMLCRPVRGSEPTATIDAPMPSPAA
ncbi:MAG: MFS transporter [Verrucomicrobia bacterium]|nr:MFS transporter [Verrucomicrobiota bacterium]